MDMITGNGKSSMPDFLILRANPSAFNPAEPSSRSLPLTEVVLECDRIDMQASHPDLANVVGLVQGGSNVEQTAVAIHAVHDPEPLQEPRRVTEAHKPVT